MSEQITKLSQDVHLELFKSINKAFYSSHHFHLAKKTTPMEWNGNELQWNGDFSWNRMDDFHWDLVEHSN